ncbi:MAG: hypothetical protein JSS27_16320 [Planctomycetes bacterium]|nr:hypothetical protein [Planctomycetota bacterium]
MTPEPVTINDLWYAIPLIVSVSLVYSATRAESMDTIWRGAVRFGGWVLTFLGIILAVVQAASWMT